MNTPSGRTRDLQLALVNYCSVQNKTADISDYIVRNIVDIFLLTETRLTYRDAVKLVEVTPDGNKLKANPRPSGRTSGGVGILFKSGTKCKMLSSGKLDSFEYANYKLLCQNMNVDLHVIYRSAYSEKHRFYNYYVL